MPQYVFKCSSCGERFEENVAMSERCGVSCKCGGTTTIVPQRFSWGWPSYVNPHIDRPTRAEMTEPSGLITQGVRDGW